MTDLPPVLSVPASGVVHDTIDAETLVINLETGSYYTLEGPGAVAWQTLSDGATVADVISAVADSLGLETIAVVADVQGLIAESARCRTRRPG